MHAILFISVYIVLNNSWLFCYLCFGFLDLSIIYFLPFQLTTVVADKQMSIKYNVWDSAGTAAQCALMLNSTVRHLETWRIVDIATGGTIASNL